MKKIVKSMASVAIASNVLMAGGDFTTAVEPEVNIPAQEVVVMEDNVKYDGFYAGGSVGYMQMRESISSKSYAFSLLAGYYFNKYFGVEARYSQSFGGVDITPPGIASVGSMKNIALYAKPMYSLTTGFALYGLAGYGKSSYKTNGFTYTNNGLQWGFGAKYELSNGVGLFVDYTKMYDANNYATLPYAGNVQFDSMNVGATYTF